MDQVALIFTQNGDPYEGPRYHSVARTFDRALNEAQMIAGDELAQLSNGARRPLCVAAMFENGEHVGYEVVPTGECGPAQFSVWVRPEVFVEDV